MGPVHGSVFLTEGINPDPSRGWPDAMSAAPYAAHTSRPILLTATGLLPPETSRALTNVGATETVVVGGPAAVGDAVVDEVRTAGHGPRRLSGANRFATSRAVYEEGLTTGMDPATVWLATGANWPDALAGGAAVGARGETLLLIAGDNLANSPATRDLLRQQAGTITRANLLGGPSAISQSVRDEVASIIGSDGQRSTAQRESRGGDSSGDAGLVLGGLILLPLAAFAGRRRRRT
jgi:hypothetical protein